MKEVERNQDELFEKVAVKVGGRGEQQKKRRDAARTCATRTWKRRSSRKQRPLQQADCQKKRER